jgi:hypothetical protein
VETLANVISYYKPSYRPAPLEISLFCVILRIVEFLTGPAGWVELKPGDCIFFKEGIYTEILKLSMR